MRHLMLCRTPFEGCLKRLEARLGLLPLLNTLCTQLAIALRALPAQQRGLHSVAPQLNVTARARHDPSRGRDLDVFVHIAAAADA